MRLHGRVVLVGLMLAAAGCGDDDDGATGATDEHTAQLVAASLTSNVVFENGVVQLGEIPDSSEDTVSLSQADQVLSLAPGEAQILALEVDNPNEDSDAVEATLMQFEGEDADDAHHVEVPRKGAGGDGGTSDGGAADTAINIDFMVDGDVCTGLCNDTFTITMIQAVKLRRGGISKHLKRTIKLDCSKKGDPDKCESSAPSGGKGGSGAKDAGTSGSSGKGGSGASGSGSTLTPATLAEEFARVLGTDNLAVCMCEMPGVAPASCVGFIPQTKVACIRDWIKNSGTDADLGPLNELAAMLMSIQSACMICDTTTCGPTTLADNISGLTDAAQTGFTDCGVEAGATPVDAGAAP